MFICFTVAKMHQSNIVEGVTTSTSYEYELRVKRNKVQLMRIRDENGKFHSVYADCPNSIPYSTF